MLVLVQAGNIKVARAGTLGTFFVQARDRFGNVIASSRMVVAFEATLKRVLDKSTAVARHTATTTILG